MFTKLVTAWNEYQAAVNASPYCRDRVQAYGMKFCDMYNSRATELRELVGVTEEDFSYALKYQVMSTIMKD